QLVFGQIATPPAAPIQYTIALADLLAHKVHVTINLAPGAAERDLQLPVWNALYQVRDFSQYVNWVHARNSAGTPLPVRLLDKCHHSRPISSRRLYRPKLRPPRRLTCRN